MIINLIEFHTIDNNNTIRIIDYKHQLLNSHYLVFLGGVWAHRARLLESPLSLFYLLK